MDYFFEYVAKMAENDQNWVSSWYWIADEISMKLAKNFDFRLKSCSDFWFEAQELLAELLWFSKILALAGLKSSYL